MFASTKAIVVIVSCALVAQSQSHSAGSSTTLTAPPSHTSPAGLDTCIVNCLTAAAASGGCASYSDLSCVCTSSAFQQASASCLQANCTAADVTTAEQLQSQVCGTLSTGSGAVSSHASTKASSGTSASTKASSGTSASTKTSSGTSASATSSSAAMTLSAPFSLGSLVCTLVASAGALIGAAFVL